MATTMPVNQFGIEGAQQRLILASSLGTVFGHLEAARLGRAPGESGNTESTRWKQLKMR